MRESNNDKKGLIDLCNSLSSENMIMIEVGSFTGESAEIFAQTNKFKKIICIDPWTDIIEADQGNTYQGMDKIEKQFDERTKPYSNIIKFNGTLDTFITSDLFKELNGTIDFIYIDGMHTYEACLSDIKNSRDIIKPKIAIGGHDYTRYIYHVRGVVRAVDESFEHPDKTFCDTSWIKYIN